jgi:hypothetical protein
MIFDINSEAPTQQQIDSHREFLRSKREKVLNAKQKSIQLARGAGLISAGYYAYELFSQIRGSSATSLEPGMLIVFVKIGMLVAVAHLLANRLTQGKLFYIDAHIKDLNQLSVEQNKDELAKLHDLAVQHKNIHKYLQSVHAHNRRPLFAELYLAEDMQK